MKKLFFLLAYAFLCTFNVAAQDGFTTITNLTPVAVSTNTGEKPQAKVWKYAGKHWAVLPNSTGTHLWRLDGTAWTNVLRLSTRTSSKADCKMIGTSAHILLFQGASSQLVSVEYSEVSGSYELWSKRTSTVGLNFASGVETATLDIDGDGRMWIAYDGTTEIYVQWSDSPYHNWSQPVTLATGINTDDICAVTAMQGKVGVFWSNQTTQRFGFRTHEDGAPPTEWSDDEIPASQSAINIGSGMADDHMNMALASDGTLFCAVKTSFDRTGYPDIGLLVRRPSGTWDNFYEVAPRGTRPIVILNEDKNKLRVVYTSQNNGGNILYRESYVSNISLSSQMTLISGTYDNSTSTKDNFTTEIVILASNSTHAVGVLATDDSSSPANVPILISPENLYFNVSTDPILSWFPYQGADTYRLQLSDTPDFLSLIVDQSGITETSFTVNGLANSTAYYWRVLATNANGDTEWSAAWSFTTTSAALNPIQVALWKMDEGSGTDLLDASEYGNNAITTGNPTWIEGVNGTALRFNGTNQYATVPDNA
ncbi:MAG TPA: fibronectin type III domain-containing protein, partial [Lunatimonas sp.]|nr:fibronectin type III domain-containing protein [Lunatimonas sp.]